MSPALYRLPHRRGGHWPPVYGLYLPPRRGDPRGRPYGSPAPHLARRNAQTSRRLAGFPNIANAVCSFLTVIIGIEYYITRNTRRSGVIYLSRQNSDGICVPFSTATGTKFLSSPCSERTRSDTLSGMIGERGERRCYRSTPNCC